MPQYRSDQWQIKVSVQGVALDTVSWDKAEGGDIAPEMTNYNPGGMAPAVALGGLRKRSAMTVQRIWSDALIRAFIGLDNAAGVAPATVSMTPIKADRKSRAGKPIVYTGVLGPVTRPNADSTSSSPALLQISVDLNESISGGGA